MIYLANFKFPCREDEYEFTMTEQKTCYDTFYPFLILSKHNLLMLDFEPVTILYGGNGSGKTTALNVIAEKLSLERDTLYNRTNFFEEYTNLCSYQLNQTLPKESRIITSDDVFDFMLNLRSINNGIDKKRESLFVEYTAAKYVDFQMRSLADYDQLKKINMARSKTKSKYARENIPNNVREHSNGESAFIYFSNKIQDAGLYLLDEPENSLSVKKQQELLKLLQDSARFLDCQFIIATHSPFLLSMPGAKIYDMDEEVVDVKRWTELSNVRDYYRFFKNHEEEFE